MVFYDYSFAGSFEYLSAIDPCFPAAKNEYGLERPGSQGPVLSLISLSRIKFNLKPRKNKQIQDL